MWNNSKKWKQAQDWLKGAILQPIQRFFWRKKELKQPFCHILCVDDDHSFCHFMQQLAYSLSIQLDTVYSIQEAKEIIEADPLKYKAFIIDGLLPDGSGFELAAWIREKMDLQLPIGFISRIYQDAASFRILKESLKVDYVLEKPIRPSEVHHLLIQMCRSTSQPVPIPKALSSELLTDLKMSYQKTIADKIERLEKMILNVQKEPSVENLQTLKGEVHKIAGSAGSYGYMAVSDLSKNLELDLIKQIDLAKQGQLNDHHWLASLDDFFTQIKLNFQIKIPELELQSLHKPGILPSVYIVDEDQTFLNSFSRLSQNLNYEILTETHPDQAIQNLLTADLYPQILLINAYYSSSSLTGYELIKAFYQKNNELTNIIAIIVEDKALDNQVEAFQRGMSTVIAKSFSPSLILPLLDQMPFRPLPLHYKVLVIDDDKDICQYIIETLKYPGLEIKAFQDLSDLENTVKTYRPDLILLDVNLTDAVGIGLLHRLRHEWEYKNLIVGMLALSQNETYLLQKCYEANVNEILFKPLEEGILQRKIAYLFKRKTNEILSAQHNPNIGIGSGKTLKHYLKKLLNQFQKSTPQMLVLFEVEKFDLLSSKIKQEIIEYISQAFNELLKKYEMVAHLEQGLFALVFQGYDPYFVQLFMRHFLGRIHSHLQDNWIKKASYHINEALVLLSPEKDVSQILEQGHELLLFARQQSSTPIRLASDPSLELSKKVFIFHDETQSIDSLTHLFQEKGFQVVSILSFEEYFQVNNYLSLVILTGSFAEAKGLPVLKKLMAQNAIQLPILHLSQVNEMEYLQHFLEKVNYFESPFSLVIILPARI